MNNKPASLRRALPLAAVSLALALGASHARAATLTSVYNFPTTSVFTGSANSVSAVESFPATFNDFNSALGTLTGVTFAYTYNFSTAYSGTSGGSGSLSGPFTLNGTPVKVGGTLTLTTASFSAGGIGTAPATTSSASPLSPDNAVSAVTGIGTYAFTWAPNLNFGGGPGENLNSVTLNSVSSVTATYTYTAGTIPEPSTWALLGVGAVVLGVTVRQRRRAS